jgi:hypothetical protein
MAWGVMTVEVDDPTTERLMLKRPSGDVILDFDHRNCDRVRDAVFTLIQQLHSQEKLGTLAPLPIDGNPTGSSSSHHDDSSRSSVLWSLLRDTTTATHSTQQATRPEKTRLERSGSASSVASWGVVKKKIGLIGLGTCFVPKVKPPMDKWVIHPLRPWRLGFDYVVAVLIMYSIIVVPYRLAFEVDAEGGFWGFELTLDIVVGVDILLNFNTAFFSGTALVGDRRSIARNYVGSWFGVDLVSTIPFDTIFTALAETGRRSRGAKKAFNLLSLGRLLKLVRLMKLAKVLDKVEVEGRISPTSASLVKLLVAVSFIAHMLACTWFMVGRHNLYVHVSVALYCISFFLDTGLINPSLTVSIDEPRQRHAV